MKNTFVLTLSVLAFSISLFTATSCKKDTTAPQDRSDTTKHDTTTVPPPTPTKKWVVSTVAGSSTSGYTDGDSTQVQFANPLGIWADNHGNLFVGDQANFSIRKVTYSGHVTTYIGNGNNTPNPLFGNISAITGDTSGNLYTIDYDWVRKTQSPTNCSVLAGDLAISYKDGTGSNARFNRIGNLAIDSHGNLYLPDYDLSYLGHIRKITPDGVVSTLTLQDNTGFPDTCMPNSWNTYPIAVDPSGNIYVTCSLSALIKKIDPTGKVTVFAGDGNWGFADGKGMNAKFGRILGMACDPSGNLWTTEVNHTIRRITPDGTVTMIAGFGIMGFADGEGSQAFFNNPYGITVDNNGTVFVMDNGNKRVRKIEYK